MAVAEYKNKRVLVTGASGFIGEHLCAHLLKQGANLTAVYFNNAIDLSGLNAVKGDLSEQAQVMQLIETTQPDVVFHLASDVHGKRDVQYVASTLKNNLLGTVNLLTAVQQVGGCERIVLAQSQEESSTYQQGDSQPAAPCSPYAASKMAASTYAKMFHQLYQLPVVMARIFMVYGPGQKDLSKLLPYTILQLLKGEPPKISSGTRQVDWIYVEDVVTGLLAMGLTHGIEGQTLDLGCGKSLSIQEFIEQVIAVTDTDIAAEFGAVADRHHEVEPTADINHTAQKLNWQPQTSLLQGVVNTVDYYRQLQNREDAN